MLPAGGTFALLKSFLPLKCGIQTAFVDMSDLPTVEAAITSRTKVQISLSTATVMRMLRTQGLSQLGKDLFSHQ